MMETSTANVKETLGRLYFLQGMPEEMVGRLAGIAQLSQFPAGAVLFRQGDAATTLNIVVTGNVSLEVCAAGVGCKRILTVGPGELLGWSPVLEQSRLTATARAMAPTQTIQVSGSQMLAICEENPRFGFEFMRRTAMALAQRLNATRLQLLDVYGSQMPQTPNDSVGYEVHGSVDPGRKE